MDLNPGIVANIIPIMPTGTNSTMFTECCEAAICHDQRDCPKCKRHVIGYDRPVSERTQIRWENATRQVK